MVISNAELDPSAVELGGFFVQPPDAVWRGLTEPDLVQQWLMRSIGFVASVGTKFTFVIPAEPPGEVACEVLTAEPGEQLTYSWADLRAEQPPRWVLDWQIQSQGRGTRLLLTQTGFDITDRRQKMVRNAMERSWRNLLPKFREVLDRVET